MMSANVKQLLWTLFDTTRQYQTTDALTTPVETALLRKTHVNRTVVNTTPIETIVINTIEFETTITKTTSAKIDLLVTVGVHEKTTISGDNLAQSTQACESQKADKGVDIRSWL